MNPRGGLLRLALAAATGVAGPNAPEVEAQAVVLAGSRSHSLASRSVGDTYQIQVALPTTYERDTTRRYPVLYVLDGDKSFGLARDVADWLTWSGEIDPILVVGIAYGRDWWARRARDMTPTRDRGKIWGEFPTAGGAERFTTFLRDELLPFINATYRTDPRNRGLAGLSFGGLYGMYALFTLPDLFNQMILVGPALAWDSTTITRIEASYAERFAGIRPELSASVYTAIGEHDDEHVPEAWHEVLKIIRGRNYDGLVVRSEVLSGETHISAWPVALTRGIKQLYAKLPR